MKFALNLIDWQARAPGLSETSQWQQWSRQPFAIDPRATQAKLTELPMMTARRLNSGSKLAVECGLAMLRRHAIDAVLYTSRHGELERNYRILQALATDQAVSPTDFTMSVHNAAVGNLTIAAKQPVVSSSLSAGRDTFQQGLCEVICLLQAGYQRVLMVDLTVIYRRFTTRICRKRCRPGPTPSRWCLKPVIRCAAVRSAQTKAQRRRCRKACCFYSMC